MLSEELLVLIKKIQEIKAESQTVEVKSAHNGCPKRLYDTLSSFSNQDGGGIIVFGLDEKQGFEAVGVYDLQDLQKSVTEQCNQMEPAVRGVFTFAEYEDKNICALEVPSVELVERPCYYKGAGKVKGSYIRVGDADLPMTDYEIYSYESYKKHVHDDEREVERIDLSYMDREILDKYIVEKKQAKPKFSKLNEEQIYEMLNIKRDERFTLAAVMNFALYPQGVFPQLGITAVVVPGYSIGELGNSGERFVDNKRIEGTISEMLEEAMVFCKRNMKIKTIIDSKTGKRNDRTEYPINAVREAILNALIHRDYSIHTEGTPIQINFFTDRLEIHSPGGLYGRMTVEQLGKARPDLRNPTLATMAESLNQAENRYSGIPTIRMEMKEYGLPEPEFKNGRNEFVVTLYNKEIEQKKICLTLEDKIVEFCKEPKSRKEIAEFLEIKTTTYAYSKYILPLLEEGRLGMTITDIPASRNQKYYKI
ncbi:ATP-binding protein [uncultured Fusobacterium sp.]|uniref:ATP-binding protein n=1 Tax=uncultured Fusobacterium sp. TaxID=159267 RepID=UPI00265FB888|nr:ATP-binding protein [uncultured Fusobacterium sp.]